MVENSDMPALLHSMQALEHLASIDLIELRNEAKIERCRATRDLSSCGRYVQHVLNSCGHASLCAECSQRCDVCPICRTSIPNNGSRVRLRLYYKCIEAGLISKRHDDRFQEKEDTGEHLMADIQRLYSLFDVALENNLVSLICHYVTDVCMDENAVSSDPVLAFLLDEVVVKDWCKEKFKNIIHDLQGKYSLGAEEMRSKLCLFQKFILQLAGISSVLEVMVSSFKESFSAQLHDLHYLLENVLKAKQHLEVMTWCARHQFLENVKSRYSNYISWALDVHERKSAAVKRAWPEISSYSADSAWLHGSTLFIELALSNLGIEDSYTEEKEEVDISYLQDRKTPLVFCSKIDETYQNEGVTCYPFDCARAAADILFLHGTSDMVVAKRAIFLYYLFDRYWTSPQVEWGHLIDDFAASFGINRHSLLESLVFYLLDDHTDQAVQEARHLLFEIAGPETHPKIAQVLLERQCPDVALTVLRCIGRDGLSVHPKSLHDNLQRISLSEAVIAVRVRIECGLLTEAFLYQRMHCFKVKEESSRNASSAALASGFKSDTWIYRIEVLVTEICHLCIRRNLVDRMIELPWNADEEKFLHKCLFGHACENPASVYGSLLMVFYVQRYRYIEAYQVDHKLRSLEQNIPETATEDILCRIKTISQWRAQLVDKCLDLLPVVQRQQVLAGSTADDNLSFCQGVQAPSLPDFSNVLSNSDTLLTPSSTKPSLFFQKSSKSFPSRKPLADTPTNLSSSISNARSEVGSKAPFVQQRLLTTSRVNSMVDGISSANPHNVDSSPSEDTDGRPPDFRGVNQSVGFPMSFQSGQRSMLLRELKGSSRKKPQNGHQLRGENDFYGRAPNDLVSAADNSQQGIHRLTSENHNDMMDFSHSNGLSKVSTHDWNLNNTGKPNLQDGPWGRVFTEEANSNIWSSGRRETPIGDSNLSVGSRWRSDESSEDEAEQGLDKHTGGGSVFAVRRRARLSRR